MTFFTFYDTFSPMKMVKITIKDSDSPWITKGIENLLKGSSLCIRNSKQQQQQQHQQQQQKN